MSTVRIGVVGAGNMGAHHVGTLHRSVSGAQVVSVADVDEERATAVAEAVGARPADDGCALIADPDVDAGVIASHDTTHADLAVAAVRAGKPVMCEKPLAPTAQECRRVVREERRTGSALISLGFMRRFDPRTLDSSITTLQAMDSIRGSCGITFPAPGRSPRQGVATGGRRSTERLVSCR
ncbi:Gfo/Idh/MocA family oxidoreductase [Streptomyces sp. FXJ1.172]|uniref:Gfo/Idh/MocA family protein n=1 Tax=Streptomyces sp. FXJ1.172 TaxID=710705 RepID=UPI00099F89C6|nr:Gfo/Idh/MocA family oxidoreductase [Streptomyces sp. FXJ1.172]WEO99546.1 Gfo/Idh/MocA family oxidoreductase [Streptomyces sp. FXJ1.172]